MNKIEQALADIAKLMTESQQKKVRFEKAIKPKPIFQLSDLQPKNAESPSPYDTEGETSE